MTRICTTKTEETDFAISSAEVGKLRPGILGGVGQGLGLVVSDVLHAQVLEDLE